MIDLWHVGDTPEIERHLAENVDRITGVHVADGARPAATTARCPASAAQS